MKFTVDTEIARVAAEDAANRQMRKAGRNQWNEADWNLACDTFRDLCLRTATARKET